MFQSKQVVKVNSILKLQRKLLTVFLIHSCFITKLATMSCLMQTASALLKPVKSHMVTAFCRLVDVEFGLSLMQNLNIFDVSFSNLNQTV